MRLLLLIVAVIGTCGAIDALAAEIHLRESCRPTSAILRLSDVAEIRGKPAEVASLGAIELGPVSTIGMKKSVGVRQIQDVLAARGVNLLEHHLTGASQVELQKAPVPERSERENWVPGGLKTRANEAVSSAIVQRLGQAGETWLAQVDLDDATAQAVAHAHYELTIRPTGATNEGRQRFELEVAGVPARIIEANVHRAAAVVVATKPLSKGAVIQASDVSIQPLRDTLATPDSFQRLEDVVGREAAKMITPGVVMGRSNVRSPLLIHRGDVVSVTARSNGLRVQTNARAREDGSLGDVITVESLLNRQPFFARVTGLQEVDVYARAIEARETPNTAPSYTSGLSGKGIR